MKTLNINDVVEVTLTDYGREVLGDYYRKLGMEPPVYGHMSPEALAVKAAELEPARDYVERVLLPGFDPAKESWREYRNWHSTFVQHTADERRTNPRPIG